MFALNAHHEARPQTSSFQLHEINQRVPFALCVVYQSPSWEMGSSSEMSLLSELPQTLLSFSDNLDHTCDHTDVLCW